MAKMIRIFLGKKLAWKGLYLPGFLRIHIIPPTPGVSDQMIYRQGCRNIPPVGPNEKEAFI